ncbi:MAG: KamA family protein [Tannerellaceae bacterium]|jgi:lysine 2,3-aminomutase|nr:KamA family protein [Tannerellaceae bacterium]
MIDTYVVKPDLGRIRKEFEKHFPQLAALAKESDTADQFKEKLRAFVSSHSQPGRLLRLIDCDGLTVDELSTGQKLTIHTITHLWQFLNQTLPGEVSADLFLDLYHQFDHLMRPHTPTPAGHQAVRQQMKRWPTGLDKDIVALREANKERLIKRLVQKIEHRPHTAASYHFDEGMSSDEKYKQVQQWWNQSRFHLTMAIKSPSELNSFMNHSLSEETLQRLAKARKKQMPFFVTPYYLSLLDTSGSGYDDATIRSYILYSEELVDTYGNIRAWEREDILEDGKPNAAGWLLPEGNNIHRRYPEVAILIPDSMGRACGGLCAPCQRMYDFQSRRLNFDFEALRPKENWDHKLRRLMQYFEDDAQLRDILITGGDALMSRDETLRKLLEAVYKMALRKKKANERRPDGARYAELQRVRLGTRLPVYLPQRITDRLTGILRDFKEKAGDIGITQCYIQTHFQSPLEITPDARRAVEALQDAGWTVTNQMVYTVAASRRGHAAKLRRALNAIGVVSYYTFSVKGFQENYAMFTPNSRSVQAEKEEKISGFIPPGKHNELHDIIQRQKPLGKHLMHFLEENNILFAGTDRNVLNLPAIGKSMTFVTAGITAAGQRILRFEHDASRRHSPIIDRMGEVYIVENKSLAAYLRQLKDMGERIDQYATLWHYCEGTTEPRFPLYEYPSYPFRITDEMTNYVPPTDPIPNYDYIYAHKSYNINLNE